MRPYMLWLTRVYAGHNRHYGTAFLAWPNVLSDWLRRNSEERWRHESYPRIALGSTPAERIRARHKSRTNRSRLHVGDLPPARGRARGAVQGER